jgi:hypothetical protein
MNKLLTIAFGTLLFSCQPSIPVSESELPPEVIKVIEELPDFDWLLGNWERLNEEEGKQTFENWEKISASSYTGIGFTMQNGDTLKQEWMQVTNTNDTWTLTVEVPEDSGAVSFQLTNLTANEFTFVNNEIDFPNTIRYWRNGDKINATIASMEFEIPYEFQKLN